MIYVLNDECKPLMPSKRGSRFRRLLKEGFAEIISTTPFVVKLNYKTPNGVQPISLGVDCGTAHVGLSACTDKEELFAAEAKLRTDIVAKLSTRREQRRTRRNRLRHREARFDNRRASKKQGWLAPSVREKVNSHLLLVSKVCEMLPITEIHVEVGNFDAQRIKNPDIKEEEYQHGEQLGFWNVREYVLARDGHTCQICHGKSKDRVLNVHHIESRKTGGDAPNNLVTLCETCHKALHRGEVTLRRKRGTALRDAAVMNTFKERVLAELSERHQIPVMLTYGYITKCNRIRYGTDKSHVGDARMISKRFNARPSMERWLFVRVRRHNRQLHKANKLKGGRLKRNQAPYLVNGFRLNDMVLYNGMEYVIKGRRTSGYFSLGENGGRMVIPSVSHKKITFVRESRGWAVTKRKVGVSSPTEQSSEGVSTPKI